MLSAAADGVGTGIEGDRSVRQGAIRVLLVAGCAGIGQRCRIRDVEQSVSEVVGAEIGLAVDRSVEERQPCQPPVVRCSSVRVPRVAQRLHDARDPPQVLIDGVDAPDALFARLSRDEAGGPQPAQQRTARGVDDHVGQIHGSVRDAHVVQVTQASEDGGHEGHCLPGREAASPAEQGRRGAAGAERLHDAQAAVGQRGDIPQLDDVVGGDGLQREYLRLSSAALRPRHDLDGDVVRHSG
ncbi:hypothetical protein [Clavibacter michiganensis]|uniref:hypothetical protein n=1 Tax=Clavibacter michiganensis TaxID=28447 RepID=UPI0013663B2E|nr:hypothetical protein [Clavibacter michiganensis]